MHEVKEHCDLLKKDGKMVEEIKRAEKRGYAIMKGVRRENGERQVGRDKGIK